MPESWQFNPVIRGESSTAWNAVKVRSSFAEASTAAPVGDGGQVGGQEFKAGTESGIEPLFFDNRIG
jgi:hypothetical protein